MVTMKDFTDDEAALYDRQIRLWGVDAQRSLRSSNVFVKGLGALGAEICKNIVLSGVNSLTLLDNRIVTKDDSATNFLIRTAIGKPFAETAVSNLQILNPLVKVSSVSEELTDDNIKHYSVVCITDSTRDEYERTNALCRRHGVIFLVSNTWGMSGFMFQDCGERFSYIAERTKVQSNKDTDKPEVKRRKVDRSSDSDWEERIANFSTFDVAMCAELSDAKRTSPAYFVTHGFMNGVQVEELPQHCRALTEKYMAKVVPDEVLMNLDGTLVPICAIVGGIVSQEIIKVVSKKDPPMVNSFFYDGLSGAGIIEDLK